MSDSTDFYEGLVENRPIKICGIIFVLVVTLINIPAALGIIWFEHFGSDLRRMFINRTVSSTCWNTIAWMVIIQIPDTLRYVAGPFNKSFCFLHLVIRNMLILQAILFFDAINIMRYILKYWLKNPFYFQDEFWYTFINIWIVSFSFISQFIYVFLPGCQTLNYSFCIGESTAPCFVEFPIKLNWTLLIIQLLSFLFYIFSNVRSSYLVKKVIHNREGLEKKWQDVARIEQNNMTDYISAGCNLLSMVVVSITTIILNKTRPEQLNSYPHYLLLYFFHMVTPFVAISTIIFMYYLRQPRMRKMIWRELKYQLNAVS